MSLIKFESDLIWSAWFLWRLFTSSSTYRLFGLFGLFGFFLSFTFLLLFLIFKSFFLILLQLTFDPLFLPLRLQRPSSFQLSPSLFSNPLKLSHTLTLSKNAATFITKLKLTSTSHMITAFVFLDPKLTLGTLFELLPLDKIHELFVIVRKSICYLILFAGHVFVPIATTVQAVVFFAL